MNVLVDTDLLQTHDTCSREILALCFTAFSLDFFYFIRVIWNNCTAVTTHKLVQFGKSCQNNIRQVYTVPLECSINENDWHLGNE